MKTSEPLVSILTACYNGEKFIPQYEKCLLSQTYRPIECIVVNDGSTDNSAELLERMAERLSSDGLLVHVIHQRNLGAAQAVSEAFSCSSGELICCWDIDDVFFPDNLSTLIETLRNNPSVDCVVCNGYFALEGELERCISSFDRVERKPSTNHFFYQLAVGETWNWAGSYVVRVGRLLEVYGGRRFPSLQVDRNSQNLQILMPCAIHGCVYVDKPLMKYIQHDSSVTHESDGYIFKRDFITVFEEIRLRLLICLDMSTQHLLTAVRKAFALRRLYLAYQYSHINDFMKEYDFLGEVGALTLEHRLLKCCLMKESAVKKTILRVLFFFQRYLRRRKEV